MDNFRELFVDFAPICIAIAALSQTAYLVTSIYKQKRAEKNLEVLLKKHENEFRKMISSYDNEKKTLFLKGEHSKMDFVDLMMLTFVKNHINDLKSSEKVMMNKVIERKNTENQIRYIYKLFSDIGFDTLFKGKKNTRISF